MKTAYKSTMTIVLTSLLLSLMFIPMGQVQGQTNTFTETWNYDGVHPEVNTGASWAFLDELGEWWQWHPFSIANQYLYADHLWTWYVSGGLFTYGSAWSTGSPHPGDSGMANYTFSQSSGNVSINATARVHIPAQGDYTGWPHFNVASISHRLDLYSHGGSYGNKVKVILENASASITGTPAEPEGLGGRGSVALGLECIFTVKTLLSKNPDTYSAQYKYHDIGLATNLGNTGAYWLDHCPPFAGGEYRLVDLWNSIYGFNYSTIPPTEIGQNYVSNVHVAQIYILTYASPIIHSSIIYAQDASSSITMNIGKITIEEVHAPVVSTSPATDVTKSSATLNGVLTDDGGEACQYRFRYQDEKSDYIYTPWTDSATTGELFSQTIDGLNPNTTYYFNAQARNPAGESEWGNEQTFIARSPEPPIASFKYSPQKPRPLETIAFDASQSRDPDGAIESYEWDFGDGEPPIFVDVDLPFIWYSYEFPGEYTVKLTVTDNDDLTDTASVLVKVKGVEFMITFDDGPRPVSTPYILDQLKTITKADGTPVRAGFFLIGEDKSRATSGDVWKCDFYGICPDPSVIENPLIVQRIDEEGHLIGIHTQHHPDLSELSPKDVTSEILDCYNEILRADVIPIEAFRCPYLNAPHVAAGLARSWTMIEGNCTDDWLPDWVLQPLGGEEWVINKCRAILQESTDSPVILIFHDHRGLPDYRFDFHNIIMHELVEKDGFVLVDFEY